MKEQARHQSRLTVAAAAESRFPRGKNGVLSVESSQRQGRKRREDDAGDGVAESQERRAVPRLQDECAAAW